MNKRLIIAVGLSFLVMVIWAKLFPQQQPIEQQVVTDNAIDGESAENFDSIQTSGPIAEENLVTIGVDNRELIFSLPSACLKQVNFLNYKDTSFYLMNGFCLNDGNLIFHQKEVTSKEAVFVYEDETQKITKIFGYSDTNFLINLDINIENYSNNELAYPTNLILGSIDLKSKELDARFKDVFLKQEGNIVRLNPGRNTKKELSGDFFGYRDRYFCAIIKPINLPTVLNITKNNRNISQINVLHPKEILKPGEKGCLQYVIYVGPQQEDSLKTFAEGAEKVVYYGIFDPIGKIILKTLSFISRIVHNLGIAIVLVSVLIFFILFPLTLKQLRSTKEMQQLQPKMEELRKQYKDNPQKMHQATIELYKEHKINPLSGCMPMVLQIPIFFSLYQALMRSIELKGAKFLWIKDLSQPDRLFINPEINLLPILMAISMFFQQKFTMGAMNAGGTKTSIDQQRLMSIMFPILFGFIFYRMPSGLVLYWFVNSVLMFIFQKTMKTTSNT